MEGMERMQREIVSKMPKTKECQGRKEGTKNE